MVAATVAVATAVATAVAMVTAAATAAAAGEGEVVSELESGWSFGNESKNNEKCPADIAGARYELVPHASLRMIKEW